MAESLGYTILKLSRQELSYSNCIKRNGYTTFDCGTKYFSAEDYFQCGSS
jgi:hypothetical protein